jgi:hypothetical protein
MLERTGVGRQRVFSIPTAKDESRFGKGCVLVARPLNTVDGVAVGDVRSCMPGFQASTLRRVAKATVHSSGSAAMPVPKYDVNSDEPSLAASNAAGGAQEGEGTSVYYAEPCPAQPAIYDGAQVYEEMDDPGGYTALGVGATVYASAAGSIDPFETRA